MSGAMAFDGFGAASHAGQGVATANELEDILYDILATGVAPSAVPGALEAVQALLHEHARRRKSPAELMAFFERYGLPRTQDRIVQAVPTALSELPLPTTRAAFASAEIHAAEQALSSHASPANRNRLSWAFAAGALVLVGAAVGLGYVALRDMQAELVAAREDARSHAATLDAMQQEATRLRAGLEDNAAVVRRVDEKSELLLQTFAAPLDPAKR